MRYEAKSTVVTTSSPDRQQLGVDFKDRCIHQ